MNKTKVKEGIGPAKEKQNFKERKVPMKYALGNIPPCKIRAPEKGED